MCVGGAQGVEVWARNSKEDHKMVKFDFRMACRKATRRQTLKGKVTARGKELKRIQHVLTFFLSLFP